MKIILSEKKFSSLLNNVLTETIFQTHPLHQRIELSISSLKKLIQMDGIVMVNVENGKEYIVYELVSLANIIGKRFMLCQLYKDGNPYGSIYVKPKELFKMKNY